MFCPIYSFTQKHRCPTLARKTIQEHISVPSLSPLKDLDSSPFEMAKPTFINDGVRDAIARLVGNGFRELESYLVRNNIRLYRSPSPENDDAGAPNFDDLTNWVRGIQSPEQDNSGDVSTFPLPNAFPGQQRVPDRRPTPGQQNPPSDGSQDKSPSPFDFGPEHPLPGEIVPPVVPTGRQVIVIDDEEDFLGMAPPSQNDVTGFQNTVPPPPDNATLFQANLDYISNMWRADPVDENAIARRTFELHDWVLSLPQEPTRTRYVQAYRDAAQQLSTRAQFNGPLVRTPDNLRVLNQAMTFIENQNLARLLTEATHGIPQGTGEDQVAAGTGQGTTGTGQPPNRRRKRVVFDGSSDEDDEEQGNPRPPKRPRRAEIGDTSGTTTRRTKKKSPPKKRGPKIQQTDDAALAESRRKFREAKAKSRRLAKERAEREGQTTDAPDPPSRAVYFPPPAPRVPVHHPQPTDHLADPNQNYPAEFGFVLTNQGNVQPNQAQDPGWLDPAIIDLIHSLPDAPEAPHGHRLRSRGGRG